VVLADVAVVVVTVPDVYAVRLGLVVVERTEAFVPAASDRRLLRLVTAASLRACRQTHMSNVSISTAHPPRNNV